MLFSKTVRKKVAICRIPRTDSVQLSKDEFAPVPLAALAVFRWAVGNQPFADSHPPSQGPRKQPADERSRWGWLFVFDRSAAARATPSLGVRGSLPANPAQIAVTAQNRSAFRAFLELAAANAIGHVLLP
jgi:hypothetical protein